MLSKPIQTLYKISLLFYNNSHVYTWSRPISNYQTIFRKSFSGCVVTTQPVVSIVREATLNLQKNLCLENHWKPIKSLWARQTFLERPQKPTCFSFSAKKKKLSKRSMMDCYGEHQTSPIMSRNWKITNSPTFKIQIHDLYF